MYKGTVSDAVGNSSERNLYKDEECKVVTSLVCHKKPPADSNPLTGSP